MSSFFNFWLQFNHSIDNLPPSITYLSFNPHSSSSTSSLFNHSLFWKQGDQIETGFDDFHFSHPSSFFPSFIPLCQAKEKDIPRSCFQSSFSSLPPNLTHLFLSNIPSFLLLPPSITHLYLSYAYHGKKSLFPSLSYSFGFLQICVRCHHLHSFNFNLSSFFWLHCQHFFPSSLSQSHSFLF